jgi:hypothetical protein
MLLSDGEEHDAIDDSNDNDHNDIRKEQTEDVDVVDTDVTNDLITTTCKQQGPSIEIYKHTCSYCLLPS